MIKYDQLKNAQKQNLLFGFISYLHICWHVCKYEDFVYTYHKNYIIISKGRMRAINVTKNNACVVEREWKKMNMKMKKRLEMKMRIRLRKSLTI